MQLALRDQLTRWILSAVASPESRGVLAALGAFTDRVSSGGRAVLSARQTEMLLHAAPQLFETAGRGIRLRQELTQELPAVRDRVRRYRALLARDALQTPPNLSLHGEPPGPEEIRPLLALASSFLDQRLYFEVHELLEPAWRRSAGEERLLLQGLIQVAVAFHHQEAGNLRGATSLLADGHEKLSSVQSAVARYGLEEFLAALAVPREEIHRQLHRGRSRPVRCPPLLRR